MKQFKLNYMQHNLAFTSLALLMFLSVVTYAQKINFEESSVVPAASGHVEVVKDKNQNYRITISLVNFAEVERLKTGKTTYVVWMVANQDDPKNIGQLMSGKNLFSKKSKASFETVSTDKPRRIFITAENDGKAGTPGEPVVITTGNF
jgi:hypothetical protein